MNTTETELSEISFLAPSPLMIMMILQGVLLYSSFRTKVPDREINEPASCELSVQFHSSNLLITIMCRHQWVGPYDSLDCNGNATNPQKRVHEWDYVVSLGFRHMKISDNLTTVCLLESLKVTPFWRFIVHNYMKSMLSSGSTRFIGELSPKSVWLNVCALYLNGNKHKSTQRFDSFEIFILCLRKTNFAIGRLYSCKKKIYQCTLVLPGINSKGFGWANSTKI